MKQRLTRLLAVLSATAMLAACDHGVVDSRAPQGGTSRHMAIIDQPIDPGDGGGTIDPGTGGGGGTTTPPPAVAPFAPPPPPFIFASGLPLYFSGPGGVQLQCGQVTHAFWGFSNDVTQGTPIYVTGVVVPSSRMNWGIYNQSGQLVKTHLTQPAHSNCVVYHEPEAVATYDMAPGYYYLYASYMGLSNFPPFESSFGYILGIQGKYIGALRVR
jgi:hypothetical protein